MKIFVGGPQRSGTSLVRSMIGSHSKIAFYPYDLKLWTKYSLEFRLWDLGDPVLLNRVLDIVLADEKVAISDQVPDREDIIARIHSVADGEVSLAGIFDAFLQSYADCQGKEIYGLKTPWNEFHAEEILNAFEDALFVHVIRDPRKSALSAIHVDGGSWFYDPLLHIKRWKDSSQLAIENAQIYGRRYQVVRYEDLVRNPAKVLRQLITNFGLSYEEGMERGDKQPGWQGTNTSFTSNLDRTRPRNLDLSVGLKFLYQARLSPQLSGWGYPIEKLPSLRVAFSLPSLCLQLVGIFVIHRGIELKSEVTKFVLKLLRRSSPGVRGAEA